MFLYNDYPKFGDRLKIKICNDIGGGFYIGNVIQDDLLNDRSFTMVKLSRKYQNGKISPVDLERKIMRIPLYVTDVWEYA